MGLTMDQCLHVGPTHLVEACDLSCELLLQNLRERR
jgi:hypothetical protein